MGSIGHCLGWTGGSWGAYSGTRHPARVHLPVQSGRARCTMIHLSFPASVLPFVPLVLRTYWSLAAGAALFALLPTSLAPSFRRFYADCVLKPCCRLRGQQPM